jgi:hypothetical protein
MTFLNGECDRILKKSPRKTQNISLTISLHVKGNLFYITRCFQQERKLLPPKSNWKHHLAMFWRLFNKVSWTCIFGLHFHAHGFKIFWRRVPGGASEYPAAMPSVGTSLKILATEICLLQNIRPLQGIKPSTDCSSCCHVRVSSYMSCIGYTAHPHIACMHARCSCTIRVLPENNIWVWSKLWGDRRLALAAVVFKLFNRGHPF